VDEQHVVGVGMELDDLLGVIIDSLGVKGMPQIYDLLFHKHDKAEEGDF
jgi:hypothetical protein